MRQKKSFLCFPEKIVGSDGSSRTISRKFYDRIVAKVKAVASVTDDVLWEEMMRIVDRYIQTGKEPDGYSNDTLKAVFTLLRIEIDAAVERSRKARQRAAARKRTAYGIPDLGALMPCMVQITDDIRVSPPDGDDVGRHRIHHHIEEYPIEDDGLPSLSEMVKDVTHGVCNRRQRRMIEADARRRMRKHRQK